MIVAGVTLAIRVHLEAWPRPRRSAVSVTLMRDGITNRITSFTSTQIISRIPHQTLRLPGSRLVFRLRFSWIRLFITPRNKPRTIRSLLVVTLFYGTKVALSTILRLSLCRFRPYGRSVAANGERTDSAGSRGRYFSGTPWR